MSSDDLDCTAVFDQLDLYLDGELPLAQRDALGTHLAACFPCADRVTFEEQLQAIVRERCAEHAPEALRERIRVHLRLGSDA